MKGFTIVAALVSLAAAGPLGKQHTQPLYTCPAGYELIGKTCERTIVHPAQPLCVEGFLKDGQCLIAVPRISECPPGTQQSKAGCQTTETIPAEKNCPPGTHDIGGACETYSVTGIVEICTKGKLVGGQCELVETAPPLVTRACPVGYTEQKGGCWKHANMDCTPPHVGKRMLAGKEPVYVPSPAKLAITQKQCEVKLEAPLHTETHCPPGLEFINNQCITKQYLPSDIQCSLAAPHLCFPSQPAPPNLRCPFGFQRNGELCTKINVVPKNTFCPPGTFEGKGGQCNRALPAQEQCPPGTQRGKGGQCFTKETTQPTVQVTVTCQGKNCYRH